MIFILESILGCCLIRDREVKVSFVCFCFFFQFRVLWFCQIRNAVQRRQEAELHPSVVVDEYLGRSTSVQNWLIPTDLIFSLRMVEWGRKSWVSAESVTHIVHGQVHRMHQNSVIYQTVFLEVWIASVSMSCFYYECLWADWRGVDIQIICVRGLRCLAFHWTL